METHLSNNEQADVNQKPSCFSFTSKLSQCATKAKFQRGTPKTRSVRQIKEEWIQKEAARLNSVRQIEEKWTKQEESRLSKLSQMHSKDLDPLDTDKNRWQIMANN